MVDPATEFEEQRPRLLRLAYRMLGSLTEAEDVVQEAYVRLHQALADGVEVGSPAAYLTTITTRLAIDELRSARARRERYVGPWLPEPILTDRVPDVAEQAEMAESLSIAFLVVLETLSPVERAVLLLHDVFGFGHREIAGIVEKSVQNVRQIAARARKHVEARRPRFEASKQERDELARRFFEAAGEGDLDALIELLAADAVMYGDGGGKVPAVREPVRGARDVARFLVGLMRLATRQGMTLRLSQVNGELGAIAFDAGGRVNTVLSLELSDGRVRAVRSILNPDKLHHLEGSMRGRRDTPTSTTGSRPR